MKILADVDIFEKTGGLERAAKHFLKWSKEVEPTEFQQCSDFLKNPLKNTKSDTVFLLVGHRSIRLLGVALFLLLAQKKIIWLAFWHDYRLEKSSEFFKYFLFDCVFKRLYSYSSLQLALSSHEIKNICVASKHIKLKLPCFFNVPPIELFTERTTDLLLVGRDVPHKRFSFGRLLADKLRLKLFEVIPGSNLISESALISQYLKSKIVIIPSTYESYSLVAIEAISCGCYVVASENVMIKDNLESLPTFFSTTSDEEFEQILVEILNKKNDLEDRKNASTLASDEFSEGKCKFEFISALKTIV